MLTKNQNFTFLQPNQLSSAYNQPNYLQLNFYSILHLFIGVVVSLICYLVGKEIHIQSLSPKIGIVYGLWTIALTIACTFIVWLKNQFLRIYRFSLFLFSFLFFLQLIDSNFSIFEMCFFITVVVLFHLFVQKFKIALLYSLFIGILLAYSFLFIDSKQPLSKPIIFIVAMGISIAIDIFYYVKEQQNKYFRERANYLYHISSGTVYGFVLTRLHERSIQIIEISECIRELMVTDNLEAFLNATFCEEDYQVFHKIINEEESEYIREVFYEDHVIQLSFSKLYLDKNNFLVLHTEDITKRKVEQERTLIEKQKYQNLYHKNQSGVFTLNKQAILLSCNETFMQLFENTLHEGDVFFKRDNFDEWEDLYAIIATQKNLKNYQLKYRISYNNHKWLIFNFFYNELNETIDGNVLDVTELQKTNIALQQSEQKYRLVYETSNDVIFLLNDETIINTNRKGTQLFGIPEKELLQSSFWDLTSPEYTLFTEKISKLKRDILQSRITKFNWQFKGRYNVIDAEVSIAELIVGNQIYHQCVIHDISDKIEAIKVLEKSAKNFKNVLENIPEGICILHENQLLYSNDELFKLLKVEEIDLWNLFESSDQEMFNQSLDFETIKAHPFQHKLKLKDDPERIVDTIIVHTEYENQNSFLIIMKDYSLQYKLDQEMIRTQIAEETNIRLETEISERKRTEIQLENLVLKTKSIYDSSNNNLVMTLGKNFTLTYINSQVRVYFKELIDEINEGEDFFKYLNMVFNVEKTMFINTKINDALNGLSSQFEMDYQSHDGIKWLNAFINPIYDNEGNIAEISIVAHDVTNKKQYEKEITDSLKEKEILLKEIHHRVKNNLQVISSILSLQCSYISDEGTLEVLQESRNRIRSMAIIHENLYQTTNFSSIDFAGYIKNLVTNLRALYYNKHTQVVINYELDEVDLILDQAVPCGLIMNELITNALKYAVEPDRLTIITISVKVEGNTIFIRVSDNGKGMPEGMIIENNDSLGLQLVQTLVEQLDGHLEYNSESGTHFLIKFEKQIL